MLGWVGLCYDGQDVKITEGGKEEKGSSGIRLLGGGGLWKDKFHETTNKNCKKLSLLRN